MRLAAEGFRNLEPFELRTDARFVVLHGKNAQGKTNALEAIYLLATLKPLRARRSADLVRWGTESATVVGDAEHDGLTRRHRVELGARRKVELDGKTAELETYFAGIRAIAFTPQDAAVVTGEPARRRAWIDRAAFTASPAHLDVVRTWRRVLDQKAAALRAGDPDPGVLDALDDRFAAESARLVTRRLRVLKELAPHAVALHGDIAAQAGRLTLRYRSAVSGDTPEARQGALREELARSRRREIERRAPLVGPQSDDVEFAIDGRSARSFGSQGQVRSTVLALKLAEMVAARQRGEVPLFLIDDVGSELDRDRKRRLVGVLHDLGAQVFATTTDPEHLADLPVAETRFVTVDAGQLKA